MILYKYFLFIRRNKDKYMPNKNTCLWHGLKQRKSPFHKNAKMLSRIQRKKKNNENVKKKKGEKANKNLVKKRKC